VVGRDDRDAAVVGVQLAGRELGDRLAEGDVAVVVDKHGVRMDAEEVKVKPDRGWPAGAVVRPATRELLGGACAADRKRVGQEARQGPERGRHGAVFQVLDVWAEARGARGLVSARTRRCPAPTPAKQLKKHGPLRYGTGPGRGPGLGGSPEARAASHVLLP